MEKIIEVNAIIKKYKEFCLENINFSIDKGSIVGLIGENGAGKSTLLKLIGSVNFPTSGSIKIFNKDIKELSNIEKEDISFILDELNFPPNIRIKNLNNIFISLFKNWENDKFLSYLKKFNLDPKKKVKELSKGMKVKLNFAVALSHKASLFILDEPTNGLDPIIRDEILDMFIEIKNNGGTILISSHLIEDLEKISDQIIFIHEGKLIFDSPKEDLVNKYDIIGLTKEEFNSLDKKDVIRYKEELNEINILVNKDTYLEFNNRKIASLNDFMIYLIRGKTI